MRSPALQIARLALAGLLIATSPLQAADDSQDWRLESAAKAGDDELVRQLLDMGVDPRGRAASAAVIAAARNAHPKALQVLLSRGARADAEDRTDSYMPRSALTVAAAAGNEECVALLLRYGANANSRNDFPYRLSLEGTSPSRYVDNHKSALMYAAEGGHVGALRQLLKARADPDATTVYDETALMFAAGKGHREAVRVLIQAGADLDAIADQDAMEVRMVGYYGGTALTYAVRYAYDQGVRQAGCSEHLGAASEIVTAYEQKKQRPRDAHRALAFGLMCGDAGLLSRLVALRAVRKGSDVLLSVGGYGNTDAPDAVAVLIRAGADVNARSEKPWDDTPLMRAASTGLVRTAAVLLDAGAQVNATTTYGETALWHAARRKQAKIVSLLLARGANPNLVTKPSPQWFSKGGTALNVAVESGCMECAKELLSGGANPTIPDASGKTPLDALRKAGLLP